MISQPMTEDEARALALEERRRLLVALLEDAHGPADAPQRRFLEEALAELDAPPPVRAAS